MCEFKSAIVLRDESIKGGFRLLMSPWTESHSELITIHKLNDGKRLYFARVEFSPTDLKTAHKVETYKLKLDEERKPNWWNEEIEENVIDRMKSYIKSIIVDGDVELLIGGQFIIAPGAKIAKTGTCIINVMCGGTLSKMCGGTLSEMCGGTLSEMCGGTLSKMCGGTLSKMCGGTLSKMWGGTLSKMWGGVIATVWEHFSGVLKPLTKDAKIATDNRPSAAK